MTLLENLCKINGQQGGTIHQFLSNNDFHWLEMFENAYKELSKAGITFPSKDSIEKLAKRYYITINWG